MAYETGKEGNKKLELVVLDQLSDNDILVCKVRDPS